ncbi:MipA/OmpV family protein [Novosphingobium sp. Chol11]|uniref:MipA/OmpV family protein n=1 Tax=Novosphingobium sp. Chol11 TaxID=1385763 RepID=UPI0025FA4916|nr:MipA/OmpV family protein [Novosphingobium sp. Chol11]
MNIETKAFFAAFAATSSIFFGMGAAKAQDADPATRDGFSGTIAGGVATVPEYEGAARQRVIPLVSGELRWDKRYFAIEGVTARMNVLNSATFEFGPAADLTFGRRASVKSPAVRALGRIDDAYQIGAFAAVKTASLITEGDELRLSVQGTRDVSNVHKGWVGEAAVKYRLPVGRKLALATQVAMRFADDNYARTYFSVSPAGAAASGLVPFAAKGGVKDIGVSMTATYALSDRWSLLGYGGYRRLVGDFADSPVVSKAGDRNQLTGGVGVGFSF